MSGNFVFLWDSEVRQMSELDGNTTHFVLAFSWDPLSDIHLSLIFEYLANRTALNVPQSRYIFLTRSRMLLEKQAYIPSLLVC